MGESERKRHPPEGEGMQPLAPPASTVSGVRSNHQEGGSGSSSSALSASAPLEKHGFEQETEMTDTPVEQGERKRA